MSPQGISAGPVANGHGVVARLAGRAAGFAPDVPAAVMAANRVVARTAAAAAEGVVVGQRRRQAQARCPHIMLVDNDPGRDAREFEPIIRAVAELSPRLDVIEPGWIAFAARGPSRYFGGDRRPRASDLVDAACHGAGIGIADGRFASGVAARLCGQAVRTGAGRRAGSRHASVPRCRSDGCRRWVRRSRS